MTLLTVVSKIQYDGDDVTVAFPAPFLFFDEDDLVVILTSAAGVDAVQVLATHYTVAGEGLAGGGTVTMLTEPAADELLTIKRELAYTQGVDYINPNKIDLEILEKNLDELTMLAQQLNEASSRSLKLSEASELDELFLPIPSANKLLGWNAEETAIENKTSIPVANLVIDIGDAGKPVQVNAAGDGLEPDNEHNLVVSPTTLADQANTLTTTHLNRSLIITPTALRVQTLPSINVRAGDFIDILNLSSALKITIEASGGVDIASFQNGHMRLLALRDTPTTAAHWMIIEVSGGASPTFFAHRNGGTQINITGFDKIEFNDVGTSPGMDNNGNFDPATNHRFLPTVPGRYEFLVMLQWVSTTIVAADQLDAALHKNGFIDIFVENTVHDATDLNQGFTVNVPADGVNDYFEVFALNTARNTSSINGNYGVTWFSAHRIGNL